MFHRSTQTSCWCDQEKATKTLNLVLDLSGMPVHWLSYLPMLSSWTVAIQEGHALMHRGASSTGHAGFLSTDAWRCHIPSSAQPRDLILTTPSFYCFPAFFPLWLSSPPSMLACLLPVLIKQWRRWKFHSSSLTWRRRDYSFGRIPTLVTVDILFWGFFTLLCHCIFSNVCYTCIFASFTII
jgi:hypothetical protein